MKYEYKYESNKENNSCISNFIYVMIINNSINFRFIAQFFFAIY